MDIGMDMARIVMRVGRLCLPVCGMKTDLHVKHKYLGCRVIAIAIATNKIKIKIKFDLLCTAVFIVFCFARFFVFSGSWVGLTLY